MTSPLTKHQWLGVVVLFVLIALFIGGFWLIDHLMQPSEIPAPQIDSLTSEQIQLLEQRASQPHYQAYRQDTVALYLHPFDPNTADSLELLQLGFRPWMAKNMLRYRQRGGVWRTKESLRRVYGMTDELYSQIEPYIVIVLPQDTLQTADTANLTTPKYPVKKDTVLNLNTCDTTDLQYLRGIGGYTARQIINYRTKLGGYVSVSQLYEIREIPAARLDSLIPHFIVDSALVTPIPVNHASVERLSRHPYLSFTQARAIYELRRTRFRLSSIDELSDLDCLTETEIERLAPYLCFEK